MHTPMFLCVNKISWSVRLSLRFLENSETNRFISGKQGKRVSPRKASIAFVWISSWVFTGLHSLMPGGEWVRVRGH